MKPFSTRNHVTIPGLLLLGIGSVLLGLAMGALAYFISTFIYFIIVFPLVIGFIAAVGFQILIEKSKVRHALAAMGFGIVTGIFLAASFYGTPYLVLRNKVTVNYEEKYQLSPRDASVTFDQALEENTGSSGFLGYMKLRATEGDEYSHYLIVNSMPIPLFSFTLKSSGAWLYWFLETLLFLFPIAWLGLATGKHPFNAEANEWYSTASTQIGSVRLEDKQNLLSYFLTNDLNAICQSVVPDGQIKHPMIEIHGQYTKTRKGNILITLKQTFRKDQSTVKRSIMGRWEMPQYEYRELIEMLKNRDRERELAIESIQPGTN